MKVALIALRLGKTAYWGSGAPETEACSLIPGLIRLLRPRGSLAEERILPKDRRMQDGGARRAQKILLVLAGVSGEYCDSIHCHRARVDLIPRQWADFQPQRGLTDLVLHAIYLCC